MALSSCTDINPAEGRQLLDIAHRSIEAGLDGARMLSLDAEGMQGALATQRGSFVTLTRNGELRGCMGVIESPGPLAQNTADCAFNAAFRDPRFTPLTPAEAAQTRIEVSVLSEMEPLVIRDREDLLQQLQPGVDGLLMEDGRYRSIFLPQVWKKVGSAQEFLEHLLSKAGLPGDYWSGTIRFSRFYITSFSEE
jgi:AmmeMemoRadiSam system protein A